MFMMSPKKYTAEVRSECQSPAPEIMQTKYDHSTKYDNSKTVYFRHLCKENKEC